ncbi:MAG: D-amino acid dehydrogenase [Gammaproteobacteria bacterium]|nr:D-amino acid dehydrogenase [Gammaproteobacteria bacterium]MXW44502.1 FAD-dependent oxidoreductase [Gammaproteobacteria bacterium]MYD01343.1 FAD-dependent oxidoreductase [Gammaproteobacteria bacterium]MYI24663.1 FAD-dependent oxidoreductase [Gammaproteobacteria bacterium]
MHVLIVGCGVIGVTTAWYLARGGAAVTVVERREGPSLETSFANGSMLTPSLSAPWNSPGVWLTVLKYLGREEAALLVRSAAFPSLLAWGYRFLRNSRPARHEISFRKNLNLCNYSIDIMAEIRSDTAIEYEATLTGVLEVCRDEAAMRRGREHSRILAANQVPVKELSTAALVGMEPALEAIQHDLAGGFFYPADEVGDAYKFSCRLQEHAERHGANFRFGESAEGLLARDGRSQGVRLHGGEEIEADQVVVAAGSYTPGLVRPLGVRVPVCPAKGYSLTAPMPEGLPVPGHAVLDDRYKAGVVPLGGRRIRVGGTVEFTGFNLELSSRRVANLRRLLAGVLPRHAERIPVDEMRLWCGLRPASPDGVPILGASGVDGLSLATGHGHLGWSMAAGTGKAVAQELLGERPEFSLAGYELSRFGQEIRH